MDVSIKLNDDGTLTLLDGYFSTDDVPMQIDLNLTEQKLVVGAVEVAQGLRATRIGNDHNDDEGTVEIWAGLEVEADGVGLNIRSLSGGHVDAEVWVSKNQLASFVVQVARLARMVPSLEKIDDE